MKYLIMGYGLTGKEVEKFFIKRNIDYDVVNEDNIEIIDNNEYTIAIRSPGISVFSKVYQKVKEKGIKMISEIELAYSFLPKDVYLIGITGSNGKTTTVELLYSLLSSKYNVYKAGNIGIVFISLIDKLKAKDIVILELSSFQLEDIDKLHLNISVITSICPNHLESVYDESYYYHSKLNILKNYKDDLFITYLNKGKIKDLLKDYKINIIDLSDYPLSLSKKRIKLQGKHNIENIKVACFIARYLKVEEDIIRERIYEFKPLEHRLEYVLKYKGYTFINDSKSTSVEATLKAMEVYSKNVILIIGGKDKKLNYSVFDNYENLYVYGSIKDKVKTSKRFDTLKEVMEDIFLHQKGKKTVLFSPSTSSTDQFKNYEERGKYFKRLCKEFVNEREN